MFEKNNHTAHFKVYQTVRIAKLKAELKAQETACAAQWTAAALDGPYEKGSHPFKEYFLLAYWLLRSELQLWGSTLPSNEESLHVFVAICEALIAELQRVLSPILSEEKMSKNNNPAVRKSKLVLVRLDVLETFNDRYEEFRDLCRPDVRHESAASMSLSTMRTAVVTACARSIEYMTSSGITEGFSTVENKADVASACDLHPAAGNIMYCCSEVQDYAAPYRRMRELSNAYYSSASAKQQLELPPVPPNSIPTDTDEFTTIVLDNLFAALEERAAKFDEKGRPPLKRGLSAKSHSLFEAEDKAAEEMILTARKHLFMANNLYSVSNHLREIIEKGEDSATAKKRAVPVAGVKGKAHRLATFAKKVETRLLAEQTAFCDVLLSALGMSPQEMAEFSSEYARDKSGQGRLLKAKFSTFNTGMDALLAQQGEWRVAAAGLRDRLAALMVSKIQSEYNAFYSTYSVVKFSKKHMDEYLKYPPAVVERHLTGFFGRA
uniref:Exocyst subunit Exo70 family protein n=1 Tax=Spumella elongata TaxID=89044 RepID=A0A7S3HT83_9STRA